MELHSVVGQRHGNFAVVVAVLVAEQLIYHFVLVVEPIKFSIKNMINTSYHLLHYS